MAIAVSTAVSSTQANLQALLEKARHLKQSTQIDPPLSTTELFEDEILPSEGTTSLAKGVLETASRSIFYDIVANIDVDDPEFVRMWNLLDILQYYEIRGYSLPTLVFWLLEELLDSQNIEACRRVFDYMESRREILIATEFVSKNLIILRLCNELLRRLSRAEDAVFCGRVFIFLFLSFPLGDKSSVNPKGDFHVENVTSFEEYPDKMDVDASPEDAPDANADGDAMKVDGDSKTTSANKHDTTIDVDKLYPVFWRLQQAFSNPTRLFEPATFEEFKKGLVMTLDKFKQVPVVSTGDKLGVGRKLDDGSDEFASSFNPKYLTSRDLFRLELSDLAFQRHILVQALILIDFLLSLTEKSKSKLAHLTTQKALKYSFTLADADAEWASGIKRAIADYIRSGPDGKFYHRMVEVVLSRDKNWVRWKLESCPEIKRAPVSAEVFVEAKAGAQKACATRRMKAQPMGSLDFGFLEEHDGSRGLDSLRKGERMQIPTLDAYISNIQSSELDLEMASGDEASKLTEAKGNTTWRALRLAARSKLSQFEKIDDGKKMGALIEPPPSAAPIASEVAPPAGAAEDSTDTDMQDSNDPSTSTDAAASTSGVADAADPQSTPTNTTESLMAVDDDSVGSAPATTAATNSTSNGAATAEVEVEVSDTTAEQGTGSGVPEFEKA